MRLGFAEGQGLPMTENEVAKIIVDVAYRIRVQYGPGLLESAHQALMVYELRKRGLAVAAEQPIPLRHEGFEFRVANGMPD